MSGRLAEFVAAAVVVAAGAVVAAADVAVGIAIVFAVATVAAVNKPVVVAELAAFEFERFAAAAVAVVAAVYLRPAVEFVHFVG